MILFLVILLGEENHPFNDIYQSIPTFSSLKSGKYFKYSLKKINNKGKKKKERSAFKS